MPTPNLTTASIKSVESVDTGAVSRTFSQRISDIKNVKDFGALGTGGDDTAAIQAAIAAAQASGNTTNGASNGGIVYFPPGVYGTSGITFNTVSKTIHLVGAGRHCSAIVGTNDSGFIIDKPDDHNQNIELIEGLYIKNYSTVSGTGAIRLNAAEKAIVKDCYIQGHTGIEATANVYNQVFIGCDISCPITPLSSGTIGIYCAQQSIIGCRLMGWDVAIQAIGVGPSILNCSAEGCYTAVVIGKERNGSALTCSGFSIQNFQTERCLTGFDIYQGAEGFVAGNLLTATVGPAFTVSAASWSGGNITYTLTSVGSLSGTQTLIFENFTPSGYNGTKTGTLTGSSFVVAQADPGANTALGTWSQKPQYGVRQRGGTNMTYLSNTVSTMEQAGWDLTYDSNTSGTQTVFINCSGSWIDPPSNQKSAFQWINCQHQAILVFNELPGQAGSLYMTSAIEGMEYDISNCSASTFGATAGGGGSTHAHVRYNGTNWTVMGV